MLLSFVFDSKFTQMKKRPASAVGYKRPISQYARVAIAMGAHSRYRVCLWTEREMSGWVIMGLIYCDAPSCVSIGWEYNGSGTGHDSSCHVSTGLSKVWIRDGTVSRRSAGELHLQREISSRTGAKISVVVSMIGCLNLKNIST